MLFCLKPAAFVLVIALELESKGRYVVASVGSPMMGIVPLPLGAALDMVPPTDRYPSHLVSAEIGSRASGDHGVTGKLGRTCLLLAVAEAEVDEFGAI